MLGTFLHPSSAATGSPATSSVQPLPRLPSLSSKSGLVEPCFSLLNWLETHETVNLAATRKHIHTTFLVHIVFLTFECYKLVPCFAVDKKSARNPRTPKLSSLKKKLKLAQQLMTQLLQGSSSREALLILPRAWDVVDEGDTLPCRVPLVQPSWFRFQNQSGNCKNWCTQPRYHKDSVLSCHTEGCNFDIQEMPNLLFEIAL